VNIKTVGVAEKPFQENIMAHGKSNEGGQQMAEGTITLNGDVPRWMKLAMLFIDRVGFPALAFILMFWMANCSISEMTKALKDMSIVLNEFRVTNKDFQTAVGRDHDKMLTDIETIKTHSYGYQDYIRGVKK